MTPEKKQKVICPPPDGRGGTKECMEGYGGIWEYKKSILE